MKYWVRGKTVLVVGATSTLGEHIIYNLIYMYNCDIIAVSGDAGKLEALKTKLLDFNDKITFYNFNILNEKNWGEFSENLDKSNVKIDILINLYANLPKFNQFDRFAQKDQTRAMAENFYVSIFASKYLLPNLKQRREAGLVNVAYNVHTYGNVGTSTFTPSMSALKNYTEILREEIGDKIYVGLVVVDRANVGLYDMQEDKIKNAFQKIGISADLASKRIISGICKKRQTNYVGAYARVFAVANRLFPKTSNYVRKRVQKRKLLEIYKNDDVVRD